MLSVSCLLWPVDPNQVILQIWIGRHRLINANSQPDMIGVARAHDDARMGADSAVKANKMPAIEGDYRSILGNGKCQDFLVRFSLTALTRLLCRQDFVSKTPQLFNGRIAEVLVGVESRHRLGILVIPNRHIDLIRIAVIVIPSSVEVRLSEVRVVLQNLLVRQAQPSPLDQPSDGMARASNARFPAADAAGLVNPTRGLRVMVRHCELLRIGAVPDTIQLLHVFQATARFDRPTGSHARRRRSIRQVSRTCSSNIVTSQTFTGNGVFAKDGESLRECGVGRLVSDGKERKYEMNDQSTDLSNGDNDSGGNYQPPKSIEGFRCVQCSAVGHCRKQFAAF